MAKTNDPLNDLGEEFFRHVFKPIKNIFIEFECLQDVWIGALLLLIRDEEDYSTLLKGLPMWNSSLGYPPSEVFKDLGINDEALEQTLTDPELSEALSISSPCTRCYEDVPRFFEMIEKHNKFSPEDVLGVEVTVSSRYFDISKRRQSDLRDHLGRGQHKISFTRKLAEDMDPDEIKKFDVICVKNVKKILISEKLKQPIMEEGILKDSSVLSGLYVDEKQRNLRGTELHELIDRTSKILNMLFDFEYVDMAVLLDTAEFDEKNLMEAVNG